MKSSDWLSVKVIYLEGISTGDATFETAAPDWDAWNRNHLPFARIVATESTEKVVGWTALSSVSARQVYAGAAEVSIYVASNFRGRGIGKLLLQSLIKSSEVNGIWTLQSSVFPENAATLALHENSGFRVVGRREKIAKTVGGRWRDTLLLERRSQNVGVD